ncbi:unnamed protein product [Diamesa tonsa]
MSIIIQLSVACRTNTKPLNANCFTKFIPNSCDGQLNVFEKELLKDIQDQLLTTNDTLDCELDFVRESKFYKLFLETTIYNKKFPVAKKFRKEIKDKVAKINETIVQECISIQEELQAIDDQFFNSTLVKDPQTFYCLLQYGTEQNFLDEDVYNSTLSDFYNSSMEEEFIASDVDCGEKMQDFVITVENDLISWFNQTHVNTTSDQLDCVVDKYRLQHYFNVTLQIILILDYNISDEVWIKTRREYFNFKHDILKDTEECFSSVVDSTK